MRFFSKNRKKVLVIGIDGLPQDLLIGMMDKGVMKGLRSIMESGYRVHPMKASLPEISSVSWTSFMTGVNPGEHGIFGFTHLEPHSYKLHFTNSKDIQAPTFWQILSKQGKIKKTLVINVPSTYPAFPIEGLLVSGFVAVDFEKAVYPSSYVPILRSMNYIIDVDAEKARKDKKGLYADILQSLSVRRKVFLDLFHREAWDLCVFCITETDRLHHFFFDEKETASFEKPYQMIDDITSELYHAAKKKWGEDFLFMILSDHGFSLLKQEVNLNAYLQKMGLLRLDASKDYYEKIDRGTLAFAMDPGRIYLHDENRFPKGQVALDQGRQIREQLKAMLSDLKGEDGTPVIHSIFEKEKIYKGPYLEQAPDLVCVPNPGYDLKGNLRKEEVFTVDLFRGMHTWENAVLMLPEQIKVETPINIEFPAKVILDYFS
jgi:predicted AlkP superfamily phosphohydrolase/phosphomutase